MTGTSSRETAHKRQYRAIGDFLALHGLEPTPDNYALVYELVSDSSSAVSRMILALTSDGVRLTQHDVDEIRREAHIGDTALPNAPDRKMLAEIRQSMDDFATVVDATRLETQNYERDLAQGAAELNQAEASHPSIKAVARLTGAMLERTREAEAQLAAARSEAEGLREQLAKAEEQAHSDPLTRLPNRRALETRLADLKVRGGTCSIAICDVDRFKDINDGHGHAVGDRVLRLVAGVLQKACNGHLVARLGGDEFAVLFDGSAPAAAGELIEQGRADLASRVLKVRDTDAPLGRISFSAGVAKCEGNVPLKRADELLYEAKNAGRDRVVVEGGAAA